MMKVLLAYDGSDAARRALARACEVAGGGDIVVISVAGLLYGPSVPNLADPAAEDERDRLLAEAKSLLAEREIDAETIAAAGDVATRVVEAAEQVDADLVVLGTRGQNLVKRAILGSVSTAVLHRAPCDVLVVR